MISEYGNTVKIALSIVLFLFIGGGSAFLVRWLGRILRVKADREHSLKLVNRGNCHNQYHLSIIEAHPDLRFNFFYEGVPLAPVLENLTEEHKEARKKNKPDAPDKPARAARATQKVQEGKSPSAKVNADGAMKAGKSVSEKSGMIANLLGALGNILPGSLGQNLKAQAGVARNVQTKSTKAVQAPQSMRRKIGAVKQSSGKLGVKASQDKEKAISAPDMNLTRGEQGWVSASETGIKRNDRDALSALPTDIMQKKVSVHGLVQTKDLEPGEILFLTLKVGTKQKRYPVGSLGYTLISQPIPLNKKLGEVPSMQKVGLVNFGSIALWRYWLPTLSGTLIISFAFIGILRGLFFIWD